MKPLLKAPETVLLIPRYDVPVSNVAFKINLRRYTEAAAAAGAGPGAGGAGIMGQQHMEVVRDLELATLCEHHLLPFHGAVHVSYIRPDAPAADPADSADPAGAPPPPLPLPRAVLQSIVTRHGRRLQAGAHTRNSAQLEIFRQPYNPT